MYATEKLEEKNEIDEETALLIEEMAISDQVNSGDLNAWRGEIKKQTINKLNRKRKQAAQEKLDKQKAAAAHAKLLKAKKLTGAGRFAKTAGLTGGAFTSTSKPPLAQAYGPALAPAASSGSLDPASSASAEALAVVPASSASAAALPVASGTAAPKATPGWDLLPVPGGWLRYNSTLDRLDAHCNRHGPKCKMDGMLAKGNIGHCLAWLKAPGDTKELHDKAKKPLSDPEGLEERKACRTIFKNLAAAQGGLFQHVWDAEFKLRNSNDEPVMVPGYHHKF